jgi:hypothetical protein
MKLSGDGATLLGAYTGNDPSEIINFENWLGRNVDGVLGYTGGANWADYDGSVGWAAGLWSQIDRPVFWSVPLIPKGATLAEAATGAYNDHYRKAAQTLVKYRPQDPTLHIRTGWEFNGDWFPLGGEGQGAGFHRCVSSVRDYVSRGREKQRHAEPLHVRMERQHRRHRHESRKCLSRRCVRRHHRHGFLLELAMGLERPGRGVEFDVESLLRAQLASRRGSRPTLSCSTLTGIPISPLEASCRTSSIPIRPQPTSTRSICRDGCRQGARARIGSARQLLFISGALVEASRQMPGSTSIAHAARGAKATTTAL